VRPLPDVQRSDGRNQRAVAWEKATGRRRTPQMIASLRCFLLAAPAAGREVPGSDAGRPQESALLQRHACHRTASRRAVIARTRRRGVHRPSQPQRKEAATATMPRPSTALEGDDDVAAMPAGISCQMICRNGNVRDAPQTRTAVRATAAFSSQLRVRPCSSVRTAIRERTAGTRAKAGSSISINEREQQQKRERVHHVGFSQTAAAGRGP
jgi:hypothetical protein